MSASSDSGPSPPLGMGTTAGTSGGGVLLDGVPRAFSGESKYADDDSQSYEEVFCESSPRMSSSNRDGSSMVSGGTVSLVEVDLSQLGKGGLFCGGRIGRGDPLRICIERNCTIGSHRSSFHLPQEWRTVLENSTSSSILCVPAPNQRGSTAAVFATPLLSTEGFTPEQVAHLKSIKKPPNHFSSFLTSQTVVRELYDTVNVIDRMGSSMPTIAPTAAGHHAAARTPLKVRWNVESPSIATYDDTSAPTMRSPVGIGEPMRSPTGSKEAELRTLKETVGIIASATEHLTESSNFIAAEMGDGKHSAEPTIWGAIGATRERIEELATEVNTLRSDSVKTATALREENITSEVALAERFDALSLGVHAKVVTATAGALDAVQSKLTDLFPLTVQDALIDIREFVKSDWRSLRSEWPSLRAMAASGRQAVPGGGSFASLEARLDRLSSSHDTLRADSDALRQANAELIKSCGEWKARTIALERDVKHAKGQQSGAPVEFGGYSVASLDDAKILVDELGLKDFGYLLVTPLTLLAATSNHINQDTKSDLRDQHKEETLGYGTLETVLGSAWRGGFPEMLGSGKQQHKLSEFPTYASFGRGKDGTASKKSFYSEAIGATALTLIEVIHQTELGQEAKSLLVEFVRSSRSFLNDNFEWMSSYHDHFCDQTEMGTNDAWQLVQYCQWAIIKAQRDLCSVTGTIRFGSKSHNVQDASQLVLAAFRTLGLCGDYVRIGFEAHPTVSPAVNRYLLSMVALQSQLKLATKTLNQEITKLSTQVSDANKNALKALDKTGQQAGGPGGKKNKRGGAAVEE